jgi:hypothetical protein
MRGALQPFLLVSLFHDVIAFKDGTCPVSADLHCDKRLCGLSPGGLWRTLMLHVARGYSLYVLRCCGHTLVFITVTVFLLAQFAFGGRLRVVYAVLHRFHRMKESEDRLEVVVS